MSELLDNERTKLLANAFDRASTASLTVGVLAPLAAVLYNFPATHTDVWVLVVGALVWLLAAVALHFVARAVLKDLIS